MTGADNALRKWVRRAAVLLLAAGAVAQAARIRID